MESGPITPEMKKLYKKQHRDLMWSLDGMDAKTDCVAKYFFSFKAANKRVAGPRSAKTLEELESELTNELKISEALSIEFSKCEFTAPAKKKMQEVILNYLVSNCSITKIKSDNELFDKNTQDKINEFLARNRHLNSYSKKLKLTLLLSLLGTAGGIFLYPMLQVLITGAIISPAHYLIYKKLSNKKPDNALIELFCILGIISTGSFIALGIGAGGLSFISGFVGITINHLRDNFIKNSIKKYTAPAVQLNAEEIKSFKKGFAAQKGFTPLYWEASTWKCPRAYYLGLYSTENIVEKDNTIPILRPTNT